MLAFMTGVPHKRITFRDHCLASNSFDSPALHKHYLAVCNLVKDRRCKFNVFSLITKYQCMTTHVVTLNIGAMTVRLLSMSDLMLVHTLSPLSFSLTVLIACPLMQQLAPVFGGKVKCFGYHFSPWCSGRHVKDCGGQSQLYNIAGWATESESYRTMEPGIIFITVVLAMNSYYPAKTL